MSFRKTFLALAFCFLAISSCGKNDGYAGKTIVPAAISGGFGHSCAGGPSGAWCWGYNAYGQLGNLSTANSPSPVPVSGITGSVTAIASGNNHTCAIASGTLKCWGRNHVGQLGNDSTTDASAAVTVSLSSVSAIAAGADETCAIASGAAYCWGAGTRTPSAVSGLTSGVTAIAVGYGHKCAVVSDAAKCWGANSYGQLGNGTSTDSATPVQVSSLTSGVTAVAAGYNHSCAVVSGAVSCWGENGSGQLGNSSTTDSTTPVSVTGISSGASALSIGGIGLTGVGGTVLGSHSCAIVSGALRCWGPNQQGQLGDATTTTRTSPVTPTNFSSSVSLVSLGGSSTWGAHSCALQAGTLYCWGWNAFGQVGNNLNADSSSPATVARPQ
jgi:alpha-tubulin suppressor-like RCC1 family protein